MLAADIRVLLCHRHAGLRAGLEHLLSASEGFEVVASVDDGDEGVAATSLLHPDVVLMDLAMPRIDTAMTTRRIAALAPRSRVLVLTGFPHPDRIRAAMAARASGFVLKEASPETLLSAVRAVAARVWEPEPLYGGSASARSNAARSCTGSPWETGSSSRARSAGTTACWCHGGPPGSSSP